MTGKAELKSEPGRDPDAEVDPSAEAEDEDLTTRLKGLEDSADYTEVWSHLPESREE